jgi:hypothetical protein
MLLYLRPSGISRGVVWSVQGLARDPTEAVERKTILLLKKSYWRRRFASGCVPPVLDLQGYMDSPKFIKRECL